MNREEAIAGASKPAQECGSCRADCDGGLDAINDQLGAMARSLMELAKQVEGTSFARSQALVAAEPMELHEFDYGPMATQVAELLEGAFGRLLDDFKAGLSEAVAKEVEAQVALNTPLVAPNPAKRTK